MRAALLSFVLAILAALTFSSLAPADVTDSSAAAATGSADARYLAASDRGRGQGVRLRKRLRSKARSSKRRRSRHERPAEEPAPAPAPAPTPEPEPAPAPAPAPTPAPAPEPEPTPAPAPAPAPLLEAAFESGLVGWNTAGVGEVTPTTVGDIVRTGSKSGKVILTGSLNRSELILGGNGTGSTTGTRRFVEGDEHWYGFSFYINSMVYGRPGAHNLIMQFKTADTGSPNFGLQLWNYKGDSGQYASNPKGLWSHGTAMGGDRFLALAPEQAWHDVVIHFRASAVGAGFYEVYLDGRLVDSRKGVSMMVSGGPHAYIKNGLYRNGGNIPGTSEIRLDAARLGTSLSSVALG